MIGAPVVNRDGTRRGPGMTGSVGCADDWNARVGSARYPRLGGTRVGRGGMGRVGSARRPMRGRMG